MIVYPNAKINLGLNILKKRDDQYHDISSVFYPVLDTFDILEVIHSDNFSFSSSGIEIPRGINICEKAWRLLHADFKIGNVRIHLHKKIPIGAGLGGGSSDGSFTLKVLNELFELNMSTSELERYALQIGADCPFFIENIPKHVEGIGDVMSSIDLDLSEYNIKLIDPEIHISTKEAYTNVVPRKPKFSVKEILESPIKQWKNKLNNDFERSAFQRHIGIGRLKDRLYKEGAIYASMTGSGSALFGLFYK